MNTIKLNTIGERPIKKSGASGGGGGGEDRYKKAWSNNNNVVDITYFALVKTFFDRMLIIAPTGQIGQDRNARNDAVAVCYNSEQKMSDPENISNIVPMDYVLENYVENSEDMTKEEFYDMDVVVIEHIQYKFDEGMTWTEWCNSAYNTTGLIIEEGLLKYPKENSSPRRVRAWDRDNGALVYGDDIVQPRTNYLISTIG